MPSVKVDPEEKPPDLRQDGRIVREGIESGPSSPFIWENNAVERKTGLKQKVGTDGQSGSRIVKPDGSTKVECREQDTALSFPRRVESSSDCDSLGGASAREIQSSESDLIAVVEVTTPTAWRKDVTAKRNEYAGTEVPKYVVVERKWLGDKAEHVSLRDHQSCCLRRP